MKPVKYVEASQAFALPRFSAGVFDVVGFVHHDDGVFNVNAQRLTHAWIHHVLVGAKHDLSPGLEYGLRCKIRASVVSRPEFSHVFNVVAPSLGFFFGHFLQLLAKKIGVKKKKLVSKKKKFGVKKQNGI
jgi:hypothetical protein